MTDLNENLKLSLTEARLPGRIISMQSAIGETLEDLCNMTAYDLSQLKGVGSSVVDATRKVLSFYGLHLSGDTRTDYYTGEEHPEVAEYRTRLDAKHPGLVEKLGTLSDREVGEEFGVSAQAINNHRRKLGIAKAKRAKAKKAAMVWMERAEILAQAINDTIDLSLTREAREGNAWEGTMRDLLRAALAEAQVGDAWTPDADADEEAQAVTTPEPVDGFTVVPPGGFEGVIPDLTSTPEPVKVEEPAPTPAPESAATPDFDFGTDDFADEEEGEEGFMFG